MLFLAKGVLSVVPGVSSVDSSGYSGNNLFSTGRVKNRSPRSSCSAPARDRCGGCKDEDSTLSDEHKLDPLRPLPHLRLIHRHVAERSSVRRVMSSSCSQPSPTKEYSSSKRKSPSDLCSPCWATSARSRGKPNISPSWSWASTNPSL